MIYKIVVATTSSDSSHYIFTHALMLAKAVNAELGILFVADPDETTNEPPSYLNSIKPYFVGGVFETCCYLGHFEQLEEDLFGSLVAKATSEGVRTECIRCFGDPEKAICEFAETWKADLIVLGRRGLSRIAELFLGSVSNYTIHHAKCSVYVVHS